MQPINQYNQTQAGCTPVSSNCVIWQDRKYKVYSLSDPSTGIVRYIGLTGRSLDERLCEHLSLGSKFHKGAWITSLTRRGLLPIITLLEDNLTKEEVITKEQQYILIFMSIGAKLTNHTKGGEGCFGYTHTEDSKAKIKAKRSTQIMRSGWNHSQEVKEKISLINKGKVRSESLKNQISDKLKGRVFSEEHRIKLKKAWEIRKQLKLGKDASN